jgi:hypothetical protein
MIKNGWLEEPPRALDRDELAKKNNKKLKKGLSKKS